MALWEAYLRPASGDVASIEKMAFPLPDNPSIAVLPFANMSEDPKQEFLCDGMTEGIITALSRVPRLFVIGRTSTSTYKGKPVKVKQVSEELGVRYVLEGSVQRSGDRVRITAQLIDALTGNHLWAKHYDRDLKDIFALQDEITINILQNVQVKLTDGGDALRAEKFAEKYYRGKQGLDCYLKLMEAAGYYQRWNIEDNNLARRMIEEAIAMCPENPMGYLSLGWVYHHDYVLGNTKSPQETLEKSMELAQKALAMDDSIPSGHALLCKLYTIQRDYDKAIAEGERALALNPGSAMSLSIMPTAYALQAGRRRPFRYSRKQSGSTLLVHPIYIATSAMPSGIRGGLRRRFRHIRRQFRLRLIIFLPILVWWLTYSLMGREKEARAEADEVLRINPKFSLDDYAKALLFKNQSAKDRFLDALRKAGLK